MENSKPLTAIVESNGGYNIFSTRHAFLHKQFPLHLNNNKVGFLESPPKYPPSFPFSLPI
jgi:hypothetical protein